MTLRLSEPSKTNFQSLSDSFRAALNEMPLTGLADHLGLAVESLDRLHVGWASANALRAAHTQCKGPGAWSFPMSDANGRVLGIRLRTRGGFKYSITGSRSGLFIPADLDTKKVLLIAEGPTDTAALLGLGFCAVGIPSCGSAFAQVRSLILKLRVAKIVVVADGDDVGIRGAHRLAMSLRPYCANVRVLIPQGGGKDIRQWINSGATNADITKAIDKARTIGLKFKVRVSAGGK